MNIVEFLYDCYVSKVKNFFKPNHQTYPGEVSEIKEMEDVLKDELKGKSE